MAVEFLLVGLGNPGPEYAQTRHNTGFWFVDALARQAGEAFRSRSKLYGAEARVRIQGHDCILFKPETFMNRSGQAVRALLDWYGLPLQQLLVAHDELDLPAGVMRLKQGGGHGGHNGLRDIHKHLDKPDYLRLRMGIGHPGSREQVVSYVLNRPSKADEDKILSGMAEAIAVLPQVLGGQLARAMNQLHQDAEKAGRGRSVKS